MNKHSFTTWVRPLVALLLLATGLGSFASTVFVKSTSGAPYVKVGSGSWTATMQASETDWYYVDVTSGSSITLASSSSGSNASPSISFDSSADSYFVYVNDGYGINITAAKTATSYAFFDIGSAWDTGDVTFNMWDGTANVDFVKCGGNSSSNVYIYSSSNTVSGTIYVKRNWSGGYHQVYTTYDKGYVYNIAHNGYTYDNKSDGNANDIVKTSTNYASITWPTKPTWYIKGNWDGSNWNSAEMMTNTSGTTWTITKNLTSGSGNIYFFLSYQNIGSNWHPRYSAINSTNQDVSAGGTWSTSHYATSSDGDPSFTIPSASIVTGTYTFSFDASTNQLTVTVPTISTSSATLYIYSTSAPTMTDVTFTQEANDNSDNTKDGLFYWYKGVYSSTTWSGNVSFTANGSTKTLALGTDLVNGGTYYYDAINTATTADYNPYANKTITIYVRSTDFPNAKLHAWYTPVDKTYSDANNIAINGTYGDASQAMTGDVEINGYHWFKKEFTGYNAIYAMLSGGDKGASGMFTAQGSPFDGTLYYYIDPSNSNWVASATAPAAPAANNVTFHVLDKAHGTTPYLWVRSDTYGDITSAWPGDQMTTHSEVINGETWWTMTVSTYDNTVKAGVMLKDANNNVSWQTPDIQGISTTSGNWHIVIDSWAASNTANVSCTYSAATEPSAAQQHNTTWYLDGNLAATTSDLSTWTFNYVPTDNGDDTYTWTATLKSGINYYFIVSDLSFNDNWSAINAGHRYTAAADANTTISLGTEYTCVAQTVTGDANYHYYCTATAVHHFTYNAKTGKLTVTKETIDPNTGKLYLIGLVAPEGQTLTNEWAANLGVEMTKATDGDNVEYFYINNVKLMSLNSGFGFATRLGSDADDWTTLNACRYGAKVVNTGDTQKVLYTEMIETPDNKDDSKQWHEMYGVGESQNTFTVEISDTYNIIFYPAHDGMAPSVHLYTATFPDVMYAITGVVDSSNAEAGTWDLKKPVQMAHDTENDVFTAEVSLVPGTLLTFSRHLGNWEHINSSRYGAPSGTGTNGYWINNDNLNTQITGLQSSLSSWSDNNAEAFVIKTNKSGLFRITLSTTYSWVKFEQLWETKGDKVHVYLEATDNITNPLISAYDKESWSGGGNIHVDRPKFSVLIGEDPAYSNKQRLCLAKDQGPAAELHTTADNRTWYSWEIDHTIADFILTNNGKSIDNVNANADDTDTADDDATKIQWRHSGEIYLRWNEDGQLDDYTRDYDETAAQEAPVVTKMIDGHYYCYFINTAKWPQSYIHAWFTNAQGINEDLLGTFPGKQMTDMVGYDDAGNEVWLFDFGPISSFEGKEPTGIIFSIGMDNGMQTGDYEFVNGAVYDYTGTVVLGRDLANIIAKGVKDGETRYIIEDDIVAVYYDSTEDALYCKDLNKYITVVGGVERSVQQDGEIDYSRTTTNKLNGQMASDRYDQSNWIKLIIHNGGGYDSDYKNTLEGFASNRNVLKAGTVRGVLPNVKNPTMEIITLDDGSGIQTNGTSTYASNVTKVGATLNVFTPAHFVGSQTGAVSGRNYFFVTPKPNEYARVTWAVCTAVSGSTATFAIPESKYQGGTEFDNEDNLKGGFTADLSKVPGGATPTVGNVYSFPAIITLNESSASPAPRRAPSSYNGGDAGTPAYDYVVYPLSLSDVTTGVTEVSSSKTVANVTYVNIAGMQSNEPFDGVNIVVTTYTDGTRSAVKVIR